MGKLPKAAQVAVPVLPDEARHLWSVFVDLDESRGQGFSAPGAITYEEIKARCDLLGDRLSPWEVRAIRALDVIRRRDTAEGGTTDG